MASIGWMAEGSRMIDTRARAQLEKLFQGGAARSETDIGGMFEQFEGHCDIIALAESAS
jgi:hypothetical protein